MAPDWQSRPRRAIAPSHMQAGGEKSRLFMPEIPENRESKARKRRLFSESAICAISRDFGGQHRGNAVFSDISRGDHSDMAICRVGLLGNAELSGRAQARVVVRVDDRSWHFIHVRSAPTNVRSQLAVRSVYATAGRIGIPARRRSEQGWKRAVTTTVTER
jgi:hypothetical protein